MGLSQCFPNVPRCSETIMIFACQECAPKVCREAFVATETSVRRPNSPRGCGEWVTYFRVPFICSWIRCPRSPVRKVSMNARGCPGLSKGLPKCARRHHWSFCSCSRARVFASIGPGFGRAGPEPVECGKRLGQSPWKAVKGWSWKAVKGWVGARGNQYKADGNARNIKVGERCQVFWRQEGGRVPVKEWLFMERVRPVESLRKGKGESFGILQSRIQRFGPHFEASLEPEESRIVCLRPSPPSHYSS
ncbi:hypothetical protein CRG98_002334 [Punica granatum]|uniref:Uncharacterized protein n=1 Tax=Punica granatum TaxID=22663 RepID=A0A2I0L994_PUNGR|nr:hypothetical protein CRG98_002334 [Punica granatum]